MIMNKKNNLLLIILGFLLSLIYIWNRFFKIKLPKELPINTYCSEMGIIWIQNGINITIAGVLTMSLIEKNLKNVSIQDISEFIPNTNKLNIKSTMDFLEKFIKTNIPKNFQKEIWENIHKFINQ